MLENLRNLSSSAKQYLKVPHHGCASGNDSAKITYYVNVTTGAMKYAGTDANVYFRITGAGGDETSRVKLDNMFSDDFERGATDKFRVKLEDIGIPTLVTIEIDNTGLFADWYASMVTVQKSGGDRKVYEFPVYSWIDGAVVLPVGTACLPQNEENPVLIGHRKSELSAKRRLYKWRSREDSMAKGLPGYISATTHDSLPRNLQYTDGLYKDFEESKGVVFMHAFQDKIQALSSEIIEKWESLDEFTHFMSHAKLPTMPDFQKGWQDDSEFGRQMINGCNPTILQRCLELPSNFPVTDDLVKDLIGKGASLKTELKKGKLYIIDCKIAKGLKLQSNACVPICLLYQHADGQLKPIAIQLQQEPSEFNPVWTPNDSESDWMLAKMFFRNAESNIQQLVYRLLYTHLVLEPFAVAMFRCLSTRHPLYKVLHPHLQYVCATNTVTRSTLISPGGIFDQLLTYGAGGQVKLLQDSFKDFSFDSLKVVEQLEKRGVASLPNYYYKDDIIPLFGCIKKYIRRMISLFYTSDNDVKNDRELQKFIKEAHGEGFSWEDKEDRGCPSSLNTVQEVIELVSVIIFTSSCQHSAMNAGQLQTFMHVPNAPLTMSKPPPSKKGIANMQTVMASMPDKTASYTQVDVTHTFSKVFEEEVYLGDFPLRLFCEEDPQELQKNFKEELKEISKAIKSRNSKLAIPYEYLLPEKIPTGVTV